MTKPFKFFNFILVLFLAILMLCTLVGTLWVVADVFNISAIKSILEQIPLISTTEISTTFSFLAVGELLALLKISTAGIAGYIILGLNVLVFVWVFSLFIRTMRPSKHYRKFRGFTFFINLLVAGLMGYQAYALFGTTLPTQTSQIIMLAILALFVVVFIYHFLMNLRGKALAKREDVDPSNFFGGPPAPQAAAQAPRPAQPARRAPPPPPPPPPRRM